MTAQPATKLTPQEYLAIERQNEVKSEYWNGDLFAMAGASRWHNLIITNVVSELRVQLKGRSCEVYPSDMRVRIPRSTAYRYPDVIVICGQPQFEDEQHDTLLNPTIIIEVLSPSTEAVDRGTKFGQYRKIDSLREYLLISQETPLIERYVRQGDTPFWLLSDATGLEANLEVSSIECVLALAEVYDKVELENKDFKTTSTNTH